MTQVSFNQARLRTRMLMAYAIPENRADFEFAAETVEAFSAHLADHPEDVTMELAEVLQRFMPRRWHENADLNEIGTAVDTALLKIKRIIAAIPADDSDEPFPEF